MGCLSSNATRWGLWSNALPSSVENLVEKLLRARAHRAAEEGVVYSADEIRSIAALAARYGVTVIVDQLYSRLRYSGVRYTHLRAEEAIDAENVVTIMGPSKT